MKSCYHKGQEVWDTGLRRICKITGVVDDESSTLHDHKLYEVRRVSSRGSHESESTCCELRSLDPTTAVGRHNLKVVGKIEKLLGMLR
jgi:hypothetical protein